jgi:branched-chain amino acid transport system substrate-binding protein
VLGQSVAAVKSLDQGRIAAHMQKATFDTVVGKVKFGKNGEWATSRTLQVQFRDVQKDNLEQFAGPGKRIVLYPKEWKSGNVVYPYKQ